MPTKAPSTTVFWRKVVVLVVLFGVFYALFARIALHAFPFSGDEYSYFLQAELFARGQLHAPAPPHPDLLRVDHVIIDQWVRSKYPPGTSALLSLGLRWGAAWLVTPLEGVVALVAMACAARRLLAARDALIAVALLGAAPLFAFQSASFFSQTASTMWLAIAFAAVVAWSCDGRGWRMVLAGAAIGCALLTRPLDALLFACALLSLLSVRAVALAAAATTPFLAVHLAYQDAQFGSPFTDGYRVYAPTLRAIYGPFESMHNFSPANVIDGPEIWNHFDVLRAFLIDWTVPGTALFALLGWVALREQPRALVMSRFAVVFVALFTAALFLSVAGIDDGPRGRYLTATLLPLAWLGGPGWRVAGELLGKTLGRTALRVVAVVVWVLPVIQLGAFLVQRTPDLWVREGLQEAVAKKGIQEGVVVVRAEYPTRYARNGPFFDRPVLYVSAPVTTSLDAAAEAFPGRPLYEAHEGKPWTIVRVR
jgi:hypothetical protein